MHEVVGLRTAAQVSSSLGPPSTSKQTSSWYHPCGLTPRIHSRLPSRRCRALDLRSQPWKARPLHEVAMRISAPERTDVQVDIEESFGDGKVIKVCQREADPCDKRLLLCSWGLVCGEVQRAERVPWFPGSD